VTRRRCKKGECLPRLPGTIVRDHTGSYRVIYCARCGHMVREERIPNHRRSLA
jgi:hypothetical protein